MRTFMNQQTHIGDALHFKLSAGIYELPLGRKLGLCAQCAKAAFGRADITLQDGFADQFRPATIDKPAQSIFMARVDQILIQFMRIFRPSFQACDAGQRYHP